MPGINVTVLMPVYNGAKYITEAIRSVLAQTFTSFELLIMDDGSTDDTVSRINEFNDPRIRLVECEHRGFAATLNNGLQEAKAAYIARFDADDVCLPDRLRVQYDFMQVNPDYILVGAEEEYIDMNGEYLFTLQYRAYSDTEIRNLDPMICPFSHTSVMYRKDEVIAAGGYYAQGHTFEDHMLWLKLIKKGKVCNLRQPLVKYRFNPESVTIDEKWRGRRFLQLKSNLLGRGFATKEENDELSAIMKSQNTPAIKEGAYYALCGKKFLFNNYKPAKARANLGKAIRTRPSRIDNYALYLLSYFPKSFISWLYGKSKTTNA
jgi:glycosyltransferase involved in cell wall biosynthesis